MVHVSVLFSVEELQQKIDEGLVRVQTHPVLPYKIYNYTEVCQFKKYWNKVTLNCRGLILDENYNIIARPWKKFFNLGEGYIEFGMEDPVEVTDKMDGSLGILYPVDEFGNYEIATRGSFTSDQSIHATKIWNERYEHLTIPSDYTLLFEIIYKENRIVLDYGNMDDLVLLGAVDKRYGYCFGPREVAAVIGWKGPVTETFEYKTMQEAFSAPDRKNAEGFVIRSGHKMVKLKQTDYVELHRIVTNLSKRTIWAHFASGGTLNEIINQIPDEFHQFVKDESLILFENFDLIKGNTIHEYDRIFGSLGLDFTRKDFAIRASKSPYAKYLFLLLDGKSIDELVWQQIKPKMEVQDVEVPE